MLARNNTGYRFHGVEKGAVADFAPSVVERCKLEAVDAPAPKVAPKTAAAIARADDYEALERYLTDEARPHVQAAAQARLEELAGDADRD